MSRANLIVPAMDLACATLKYGGNVAVLCANKILLGICRQTLVRRALEQGMKLTDIDDREVRASHSLGVSRCEFGYLKLQSCSSEHTALAILIGGNLLEDQRPVEEARSIPATQAGIAPVLVEVHV